MNRLNKITPPVETKISLTIVRRPQTSNGEDFDCFVDLEKNDVVVSYVHDRDRFILDLMAGIDAVLDGKVPDYCERVA